MSAIRQGGQPCSVPFPEGIFPFRLSRPEQYGLTTTGANNKQLPSNDLVPRKRFKTARLLECMQKDQDCGLLLEPCADLLRQCNLDHVVVVCDAKARYGETYILLHTLQSIEFFRLDENDAMSFNEAGECMLQPRPYVSDTNEDTSKEIQDLDEKFNENIRRFNCTVTREKKARGDIGSKKESGSISVATIQGSENLDETVAYTTNDTSVQCSTSSKTTSAQTLRRRKVDTTTQCGELSLVDFGYDENLAQSVEVANSFKRVAPLFEMALQQNETVDIFRPYNYVPDKGNMSNFRNAHEDEGLIEVRNFTDLDFTKGKHIQYIDVHPERPDIIAASACDPATVDELIPFMGTPMHSHIILWRFGLQMRPFCVLRAPLDCPVFRFCPTQPHILVGGCRNGQMAMWDISQVNFEKHSSGASRQGGDTTSRDKNKNLVTLPKALSMPEHGHKSMIHDITWLPPHIQINAKGDLLAEEYLSDKSHQFFTVSGDGQLICWDLRFREILRGELPFIAKVKSTRQQKVQDDDAGFPTITWVPVFKIKPKRLEGIGELSMNRAFKVPTKEGERSTNIICTSEEGEILSVNWCPEKDEAEKDTDNFSSKEYVQWMKKDHNRPPNSLSFLPFFPSFVLTASDWNFHIWEGDNSEAHGPLFSSPNSTSYITCAQWSPTRPGVLFVGKTDGAIDIWDMSENCYSPQTTIALVPNSIISMEFLTGSNDNQTLAIGDSVGSLHVFKLPDSLVNPFPREEERMLAFLERECKIERKLNLGHSEPNNSKKDILEGNTSAFEEGKDDYSEEMEGLTEDEELAYLEMERNFLSSFETE